MIGWGRSPSLNGRALGWVGVGAVGVGGAPPLALVFGVGLVGVWLGGAFPPSRPGFWCGFGLFFRAGHGSRSGLAVWVWVLVLIGFLVSGASFVVVLFM